MNHSMRSADRNTHLKIVMISLIGAVAISTLAICSRVGSPAVADGVVRPVQPLTMSGLAVAVTR